MFNEYSPIEESDDRQEEFQLPTEEMAYVLLTELREDSSTGSDNVPARILKKCARALAKPIALLVMRIILMGQWPDCWRDHWIIPIFKKGPVFKLENYRAIHIIAQLSKIAERITRQITEPFLEKSNVFGFNQFAYRKARGARDALALLMLEWLSAFNQREKIVIYCSDVAGAFDRVRVERLISKLHAKGVHPKLVKLIESWLQERRARVLVGGEMSGTTPLRNMVFQGTVLGPILWLVFFADASKVIIEAKFREIIFADDLNAYKSFPESARNSTLMRHAKTCQVQLHDWGKANQIESEPKKKRSA